MYRLRISGRLLFTAINGPDAIWWAEYIWDLWPGTEVEIIPLDEKGNMI